MRKLAILHPAKQEIKVIIGWYENVRTGLGDDFHLCLESLFDTVRAMPHLYPPVMPGAHKALVRRFPYVVYFQVTEETVAVIAVIHVNRSPQHWKTRIEKL